MKAIFTITLVLLSAGIYAQDMAKAKANLKQAALGFGDALMRKDFRTFVLANTYPAAVEQAGGAEKMIAAVEKQVTQIENSGNQLVSAWPGDPSEMIDTAGELQCTMPQFVKLRLPAGDITSQTTLVCISMNHGASWYFIDAGEQNLPALRQKFPNISSKLVIPRSAPPVFEAKK